MPINTNATNIVLSAPAAVATPPSGQVTYFFNTDDANRLYYKDSSGNVWLYSDPEGPCCACEAMHKIIEGAVCAFKKGLMTAAEYQTFVTSSISVTATETYDPVTGTRTCTVSLNPTPAP